jgi:hypothetical protein
MDVELERRAFLTPPVDILQAQLAPEIGSVATSTTVTWLAIRPGYRSGPGWQEAQGDTGMLNLLNPGTRLDGVAALVFGIGTAGMLWVDRLARSAWFSGLTPDKADLRAAGSTATRGSWSIPSATAAPVLKDLMATAGSPGVALATVAIGASISQTDEICATTLVDALRTRRCHGRCRTTVVVTLDLTSRPATRIRLARTLREAGAFVIEPADTAKGLHLHHFPLRAAIMPRGGGRLVCADLADHLACWPPGSWARLYRLKEETPLRLPTPCAPVRFHILHWHADLEQISLLYFDRQSSRCRRRWGDANTVFTTAETMDGSVGSFDLLLVH